MLTTSNSNDESIDWMDINDELSFPQVDKKKENENVICFQKTGNKTILEELYEERVPTLQVWARKYYYLKDSKEDMFQELTQVFIRTVHGYRSKRKCKVGRKTVLRSTPFNTYLWYSLGNYVKNLNSGLHAKKRTPKGVSGNFLLSLDYSYKDGDSETTLKDRLSNSMTSKENSLDRIYFDEALDLLSYKDKKVKSFLKKIGDGTNITALLKECRKSNGKIKISKVDSKNLNVKRRHNRMVKNLIKKKGKIGVKFSLLSYQIEKPSFLCYEIEFKKSSEADYVAKIIRKLRKNQDLFADHIGS